MGANDYVTDVALQPDGRIIIAGFFTKVDGIPRRRIARLNADGSLDTGFDPGAGPSSLVTAVAIQADGKVVIGGHFAYVSGVPYGFIARLNEDGTLDTSFDPGSGVQGSVEAMALQADGKVLIGGTFSAVDNVPRMRVARLNGDGSVDTTFNPGSGANETVFAIAAQPDGKVLIGGEFTAVDSESRRRIARLNGNGSLDTTFNPGTGANRMVHDIALQDDGKMLVGGWFDTMDGVAHPFITRLHANGSADTSFDPGSGAPHGVKSVAVQPDGKVLIGGWFREVDGVTRRGIARLNADGSVDDGFDDCSGANAWVNAVALQPDGKVVIVGQFTEVNDVPRTRVARLNADGSLDTTFDPGLGPDSRVRAIALQADGKILIGGDFVKVDGEDRNHIARLNWDGSLDPDFVPTDGPNDAVNAIAVVGQARRGLPDMVLIGGDFTRVDGTTCNHIARLNGDGSLDTNFDCDPGASHSVRAIALQPDGKVLIGGAFGLVDGVPRKGIARLHSYGTLDITFAPPEEIGYGVLAVTIQPDGKVLVGGGFVIEENNVEHRNISRLNANGSLDITFDTDDGPGHIDAVATQPDGKILIGGHFSTVDNVPRKRVARLNADGSLDTSFDTSNGANDRVHDLVVQPDGKVVIVGRFTEVEGVSSKRIARLKGDAPPIP